MKNFNILILSFLAILVGTGCRKDLNQEPFSAIAAADAFSNASRIDKSAVGMYDQLQNLNYFGGRILIYADQRGIDANPAAFFGNVPLFTTMNASDAFAAGAWQGAYRTIYECNYFLANFTAEKQAFVSAAKANQYIGEAKFIRSLCYFYLVNMYAQPYKFTASADHLGVPIVLAPAANPFDASNQVPRNTVKQVYDQMEADFLDAETKLPTAGPDAYTTVSRATKDAARGMLARLYLYKQDYIKAAAFAATVIAGPHALNADPVTPFRTYTTSESIFSVAMDGGDNPNTNNAIGQHYGAARRADIPISAGYVALMNTATDKRYLNLVQLISGSYWTSKYNAGTTDWVPVLRLSEMLLIRAEALANLAVDPTPDPNAIILLNQVRTRSGATALAPATKTLLIDAILTERRIELAFEGQGELDFLRTGRGIPAHSIVTAQAYGSNYVVFPIPKYDTDKNPNLVQNPGY